jgi:glc operon protein GlcG
MYQTYHLSHIDALKIVAAIQAELEKTNRAAAIAVADAHGELIAFLRLDGCKLPSLTIAINKAFTAAREGAESKNIGQRSREEGFPMTNFGDLRFTGWGGGVPITYQDKVIGAVGVSGVPEAEDMALAQLGVQVFAQAVGR